uniref:Uncharacterized protein n=1 Tax=Oryza nivara TaxID=4536 RepID=A0A0E0HLT5_ORYNI
MPLAPEKIRRLPELKKKGRSTNRKARAPLPSRLKGGDTSRHHQNTVEQRQNNRSCRAASDPVDREIVNYTVEDHAPVAQLGRSINTLTRTRAATSTDEGEGNDTTVAAVAEADEVGGDSCSGQGQRQRHTEATSTVDKDEGSGGRSGQRRQRRRTRTCATMAARPWTWTLRRRQRRVARRFQQTAANKLKVTLIENCLPKRLFCGRKLGSSRIRVQPFEYPPPHSGP